jgi:hypothetical protein
MIAGRFDRGGGSFVHTARRRRTAVLLTVLLVVPGLLSHSVAGAATRSLPLQDFQTKGFVTARTEWSMTVLEGGRAVEVVVTARTRVLGRRHVFAKIVVDDVVRVEGTMMADRRLLASQVEVLLEADGMKMTPPPAPGLVGKMLSVIMSGGITVPIR